VSAKAQDSICATQRACSGWPQHKKKKKKKKKNHLGPVGLQAVQTKCAGLLGAARPAKGWFQSSSISS